MKRDWAFEQFCAWTYNQQYGVKWLSIGPEERMHWRSHVLIRIGNEK